MLRVFKHYIPGSLILLAVAEWLILFVSIEAAINVRMYMIGSTAEDFGFRTVEVGTFVAIFYFSLVAVGLYEPAAARDLRVSFLRLMVATLFSIVIFPFLFFFFPDVATWRSILVIALLFAVVGISLARAVFAQIADLDTFKSNVLVLGAGAQAQDIFAIAADNPAAEFQVVDYIAMPGEDVVVQGAAGRSEFNSLEHLTRDKNVSEIVLAMEERRGILPLQDLLACKLRGCEITDFVSFIEKARGYVDLDRLQPSWLIFSSSFGRGNRLDQIIKRMVDIVVSIVILIATVPIFLIAALAIKLTSRGPLLYLQERVGLGGRTFSVIKFRSMKTDAESDGVPKWADENDPRVTPVGHVIRATRIDELPQILNVLKGDMSFVGPRPERPFFVDTLAGQVKYYNERHTVKPGITGWAQLKYPYGASVSDAKRKLEYDLYYIKNYTVFLDFLILLQTARVVLWPHGVR